MIGTSLMHWIKFCFVFMGVSGDSQLDSCPDSTSHALILCDLASVFFISVRRKEKYGRLMRLPSHKENGLVNQVKPLGVVHTLTTRINNNLKHPLKIFSRVQNVTVVREVLCKDIAISCPYYNLGIGHAVQCGLSGGNTAYCLR